MDNRIQMCESWRAKPGSTTKAMFGGKWHSGKVLVSAQCPMKVSLALFGDGEWAAMEFGVRGEFVGGRVCEDFHEAFGILKDMVW